MYYQEVYWRRYILTFLLGSFRILQDWARLSRWILVNDEFCDRVEQVYRWDGYKVSRGCNFNNLAQSLSEKFDHWIELNCLVVVGKLIHSDIIDTAQLLPWGKCCLVPTSSPIWIVYMPISTLLLLSRILNSHWYPRWCSSVYVDEFVDAVTLYFHRDIPVVLVLTRLMIIVRI